MGSMKAQWVWTFEGSSVVITGFTVLLEMVGCIFGCVDRRPWHSWRRWPLVVAMDLWRCFCTRSAVRPGQVVKCPASMALSHVDVMGLQHAWCR